MVKGANKQEARGNDETYCGSGRMITIKFRSGEQRRFKAGTTELRDGTLMFYTKHRRRLWWCPTFPVEKIEWVRLSNGSVIIEDPDRRMWACKEAAAAE